MILLAVERYLPFGPEVSYPLRVLAVSAVLLAVSRPVIDLRASNPLGSVLLGVVVFAIWVGPDALWPSYRSHWLFNNSIVGQVTSSAPESARSNLVFIAFRAFGCVVLVPIVEELFWRGWLA